MFLTIKGQLRSIYDKNGNCGQKCYSINAHNFKLFSNCILESCYCDGTENFDCMKIKSNMDKLCFRDDLMDNEIDVDGSKKSGSWMAKMERFLIVFTIIVSLIINWVGTSFQFMVNSVNEFNHEPPPPPEEIGITGL